MGCTTTANDFAASRDNKLSSKMRGSGHSRKQAFIPQYPPSSSMRIRSGRGEGKHSSPARRKSFWLVMLFIPFVVLLGGELFLKWIDYGGTLDLVVKTRLMGKEWY